jgi:hypothetical protein
MKLGIFIALAAFLFSVTPIKAETVNAIVTGDEAGVVLLMLPDEHLEKKELATQRVYDRFAPEDTQNSQVTKTQLVQEERNVFERFRDTFRRDGVNNAYRCQQLVVETTAYDSVPATIDFRVDAERNGQTGKAPSYRIDYGDGTRDVNSTGTFSHTFTRSGDYTVQGYVQNADGSWNGGSFCQRKINLAGVTSGTVEPGWSDYDPTVPVGTKGGVDTMTTQPATGPATFWVVGSGLSALAGLGLRLLKRA